MTLSIGDKAPTFKLRNDNDQLVSLKDFTGKKVVLYFYPKDDTPGCTRQACGFRDQLNDFKKNNAVVLGISKDNITSHQKFKSKYSLTFPLLADENGEVCQAYGVIGEKNNFGKKSLGIIRTTFLIDEKGIIRHIWHKVKVDGHIEAVKAALQ